MILPRPAELVLAATVAAAVVSVPGVLFRVFLHVPFSSTRGQRSVRFIYVFSIELVMCGAYGFRAAEALGAGFLAVALAYYGTVTERGRRLNAWCKGLADPTTRDASRRSLERELARRAKAARSDAAHASYARTVDAVGVWLDAAGLTSAAVDAMQQIRVATLKPLARARHTHQLAAFRIRCGDRETARKELATLARPLTDATWEDAVAALEALLLVLDGDAREGETRARAALERTRQPNVRSTWQSVLAHALAAQGERDQAIEVLRDLRSTHGATVLERVARQGGAASPIAEALQHETEAPYR